MTFRYWRELDARDDQFQGDHFRFAGAVSRRSQGFWLLNVILNIRTRQAEWGESCYCYCCCDPNRRAHWAFQSAMTYVINYKDRSGVGHRISVKSAETAWVRLVVVENSKATSITIFKGVQHLTRKELWDAYELERADNPNWELTAKVQSVLWEHWDPIGVGKIPEAHGEYDSYAPRIADLLREGVSEEDLTTHLINIETETMGLPGGRSAKQAAAMLMRLRP